jgi:sugar phosphate isomerase/epimerase
MEIGLSSLHFKGLDLVDSARAAADVGFRWVELWQEQLRDVAETGSALARRLRATGIRWGVHADMRDLNLASRNAGIRRESLRQVIDTVCYAAELEAPFVTVHPGRMGSTKDTREEYFEIQVETLAAICAAAAAVGVRIAFENMEPRPLALVTTWAELRRLIEAVALPALGVTLDVAHLYGLPRAEADLLVEQAAPLVNVHVSDASGTAAHLLLGDGTHDYAGLMARLAPRYAGPVIIEGYAPGLGLAVLPRLMTAWKALGL